MPKRADYTSARRPVKEGMKPKTSPRQIRSPRKSGNPAHGSKR